MMDNMIYHLIWTCVKDLAQPTARPVLSKNRPQMDSFAGTEPRLCDMTCTQVDSQRDNIGAVRQVWVGWFRRGSVASDLESQWPMILGNFVSILGLFREKWPAVLGYSAFQGLTCKLRDGSVRTETASTIRGVDAPTPYPNSWLRESRAQTWEPHERYSRSLPLGLPNSLK